MCQAIDCLTGDGEVIFDGAGNYNLFNVQAADYHYFEGVATHNTEIAILAGTQFIVGSKGLTVKHLRFEDLDGQIHPPAMESYVAVKVYGPGHVVA